MKIHHVGYLVADIDIAMNDFIWLGYELKGEVCVDQKRNIKIQFLKNGNHLIELVSPLNDSSPVNNTLKKSGSSPYHICYETPILIEQITKLKKQGYIIIAEALEAPAIGNKKVVFLYKNSVGIVELVEK